MEELKNNNLVYFSASWCGPCKVAKPIVEKIKQENPEFDIKIFVIDQEDNGKETASMFNVRSVPSFVFLKDGEIVETVVGVNQEKEILEKLEKTR